MKFTLVLLIVSAIVGCALSCSDAEFESFKVKFDKNYADEKENDRRKEVFCENLRKINAHNRLFEQGLTTFTMGVNQFSDLTSEEFQNSGYLSGVGFGGKQ